MGAPNVQQKDIDWHKAASDLMSQKAWVEPRFIYMRKEDIEYIRHHLGSHEDKTGLTNAK